MWSQQLPALNHYTTHAEFASVNVIACWLFLRKASLQLACISCGLYPHQIYCSCILFPLYVARIQFVRVDSSDFHPLKRYTCMLKIHYIQVLSVQDVFSPRVSWLNVDKSLLPSMWLCGLKTIWIPPGINNKLTNSCFIFMFFYLTQSL